jgi:pentatricopeptide repeat protein
MLVSEGRVAKARLVVEQEMSRAGIEPNTNTGIILSKNVNTIEWKNMVELKGLLRDEQIEKAWLRLNTMYQLGSTGVRHFTLMMKACSSSEEMIQLMERMRSIKVRVNVFLLS